MSERLQRWSDLPERIILGQDTYLQWKEVRFVNGRLRESKQDQEADELAALVSSNER